MRFLFLLLLLPVGLSGQTRTTLSGYLKDSSNGEALIGATIYIKSLATGATTNVYGFYSLTLDPATYEVTFSYIGYATQVKTV
ncbi:MAG TPA: carboxypeptidase-like regulatory domain-containing protein, partial [Cyclobacteriaceae bacterium]|nr:carboxypeptidase-like regulatory domain-containing protein [Cyclobacteriaceae bacterium]